VAPALRELLEEVRAEWAETVTIRQTPGGRRLWAPCWFGENLPGIDGCEGRIEGAHWIKRQQVERKIALQLGLPEIVTSPKWQRGAMVLPNRYADLQPRVDLVFLAGWDPRGGVPACEKHHRRFDGHRVDATRELVVWRHEVPAEVEAFAGDWGLEYLLDDRHPPIGKGI
jgi:hypothetical protein